MPLTDAALRQIKPTTKGYKLFDGGGLFILVTPKGGKWWRLKYRFGGKEKLLALGVYPQVSLKEARARRTGAKDLLAQGIDPSEARKQAESLLEAENTFEAIAREWHGRFTHTWSPSHCQKLIRRLELYLFPWLGKRPIDEITAPELMTVLGYIEVKGHLETAHRVLNVAGQVFRYAIQTGRLERNPAADLKGAIPPPIEKHMAHLREPKEIGHLLQAIASYSGAFVTCSALRLAPMLFLRPGELRKLEWYQVDLEAREIRLPIEHMKRSQQEKTTRQGEVAHIVPLCRQAREILESLHPLTGDGRYLFPGLRSKDKPMSDAALINALRRMGYTGEEMSVHGFRHLASTRLHELGYPSRLIEKQLAHSDHNKIRGVYNHAEYLPERHKMMQEWADYLDGLKAAATSKQA